MSDPIPAVFLDRDGTLIEDVGVLSGSADIRLIPGVIPALRQLQERYTLFVITNQSAVSTGQLSMAQVKEVNCALDKKFRLQGIHIRKWYVCPHGKDDGCMCRKPRSFFVRVAEKKFCLDLKRFFSIGDHPHDALIASDSGLTGLYLLTGHGTKHLADLPPEKLVFHNLSDAVSWIIGHPAGEGGEYEPDDKRRCENASKRKIEPRFQRRPRQALFPLKHKGFGEIESLFVF